MPFREARPCTTTVDRRHSGPFVQSTSDAMPWQPMQNGIPTAARGLLRSAAHFVDRRIGSCGCKGGLGTSVQALVLRPN